MNDLVTLKKEAGIFYGWWVVIAATAVITSQGVMFYGFGILFPSILDEFQQSRAVTSSVYSAQLTTNSLFILLMGYLIDKFSPRLLVGLGTILLGVGFVFASFAQNLWGLYFFFGVVVAVGMSTMYVPPVTVVTRWFEAKRGLALGIAVTGIGIGGSLGSPFLNWLIQSFGWRAAVRVLGVALGAFTLLSALVLVGHPREKGLRPYGAGADRPDYATRSPPSSQRERSPARRDGGSHWTVARAVKTPAFRTLFAMLFLAEVSLIGVMTHLFTHAAEGGVPQPVVSWAYSVIGVTSLVGKVGGGALSDRTGRRAAFLLSFVMEGTALLLLLLPPNPILLYVFAVLLGLSYGGWTPLFPAIVGDFFGLQSMGKIYSVLTITFFLGGICGPVLAGWVFDRMGSYFAAFVVFSAICYLAGILSLFLRPPGEGRIPAP